MEVELQLAAFKMSAIGTPIALAFDLDPPKVECAENLSASMPANFMILFHQWPIVTACRFC